MAKYNLPLTISSKNPKYAVVWAREFRKKYPEKAKELQTNYRKNKPLKYLFNLAKRRAKKKHLEFTIVLTDLGEVPTICPLLGIPIDSFNEEQKYHPSIDRKDSTKGYIPGNVMIISHRANMLKNNASTEELMLLTINLSKLGI